MLGTHQGIRALHLGFRRLDLVQLAKFLGCDLSMAARRLWRNAGASNAPLHMQGYDSSVLAHLGKSDALLPEDWHCVLAAHPAILKQQSLALKLLNTPPFVHCTALQQCLTPSPHGVQVLHVCAHEFEDAGRQASSSYAGGAALVSAWQTHSVKENAAQIAMAFSWQHLAACSRGGAAVAAVLGCCSTHLTEMCFSMDECPVLRSAQIEHSCVLLVGMLACCSKVRKLHMDLRCVMREADIQSSKAAAKRITQRALQAVCMAIANLPALDHLNLHIPSVIYECGGSETAREADVLHEPKALGCVATPRLARCLQQLTSLTHISLFHSASQSLEPPSSELQPVGMHLLRALRPSQVQHVALPLTMTFPSMHAAVLSNIAQLTSLTHVQVLGMHRRAADTLAHWNQLVCMCRLELQYAALAAHQWSLLQGVIAQLPKLVHLNLCGARASCQQVADLLTGRTALTFIDINIDDPHYTQKRRAGAPIAWHQQAAALDAAAQLAHVLLAMRRLHHLQLDGHVLHVFAASLAGNRCSLHTLRHLGWGRTTRALGSDISEMNKMVALLKQLSGLTSLCISSCKELEVLDACPTELRSLRLQLHQWGMIFLHELFNKLPRLHHLQTLTMHAEQKHALCNCNDVHSQCKCTEIADAEVAMYAAQNGIPHCSVMWGMDHEGS